MVRDPTPSSFRGGRGHVSFGRSLKEISFEKSLEVELGNCRNHTLSPFLCVSIKNWYRNFRDTHLSLSRTLHLIDPGDNGTLGSV